MQAAFSQHNQLVEDLFAKSGPLSSEVRACLPIQSGAL